MSVCVCGGGISCDPLTPTLDPESNSSTEMFHKNFSFLNLRGEHLTPDHGTERNLK